MHKNWKYLIQIGSEICPSAAEINVLKMAIEPVAGGVQFIERNLSFFSYLLHQYGCLLYFMMHLSDAFVHAECCNNNNNNNK